MWIFAIITKNLSDFENRCNVVIFLLLGRTKANVKGGEGTKQDYLKVWLKRWCIFRGLVEVDILKVG